ncbi:MAG: hypothetical protein WAW86_09630 [Gammaproteobacteria bacterium]
MKKTTITNKKRKRPSTSNHLFQCVVDKDENQFSPLSKKPKQVESLLQQPEISNDIHADTSETAMMESLTSQAVESPPKSDDIYDATFATAVAMMESQAFDETDEKPWFFPEEKPETQYNRLSSTSEGSMVIDSWSCDGLFHSSKQPLVFSPEVQDEEFTDFKRESWGR